MYIHTDGLGSPVARTDKNGNLISRTRYEPYGATAAGATPTIGFTGHVNDPDTGLIYMQQRYYDPCAGRFLSTDPMLTDGHTGGGFNRYVYANLNPYRFIDPDGREPSLLQQVWDNNPWVMTAREVFTSGGHVAADLAASGQGAITNNAALSAVAGQGLQDHQEQAVGLLLTVVKGPGKSYTPGGKFSPTVKKAVAVRADNTCQYCGTKTVPAKKSEKGVTPPQNEGQTDHIDPASNGGTNSPANAAHACRKCNRDLSDKPKPPPPPPPPPPPAK